MSWNTQNIIRNGSLSDINKIRITYIAMQQALEFLQSNKEVAFATIEGDKPKLRMFQIMKISGSTLYFATAPNKAVYKQLRINSNVELLSINAGISVRVVGNAIFDVDQSVCAEIFDTNEVLQRLYPNWESLVYFRLPIKQIDYYDLNPQPPVFKHFQL